MRTLPLNDHPLVLIVQNQYLDANPILGSSLELHGGHRERRIPINIDNDLLGRSDLRADRTRQPKAHRPESTTRDHCTWVSPPKVLRGPHLVLPYAGSNDHILLTVCGKAIELLDDSLRLHHFAPLRVREWVRLLPTLDIVEPLGARGGFDERDK